MLPGGKFIIELHLRQTRVTYGARGLFTKYCKRIQKFKEMGDLNGIYKSGLGNLCFAHDSAYSDSEDLAQRTISDNVSKERAFKIIKNPRYDGYQRGLARGNKYKWSVRVTQTSDYKIQKKENLCKI